MSRRTSTDVVVIGAGLAGLNAALHLQEGGARVQVLEARDQVGGRVHSMRQLGHSQEAGGTYIGAGYDRITSVCARVGIDLVDVSPMLAFFREQDLVLGGELIRQSEWPEHPRNVLPDPFKDQMPWTLHRTLAVQDNPLPGPERWLDPEFAVHDVSVRTWLTGLGLDESAVRLAYDLNPSFGDHAGDISALLLFFRAAFSIAQRQSAPDGVLGYTVKNGVQRIPEAMADLLEHDVHFGRVVTAITTNGQGAEVHCAGGAVYAAPHVVCALPIGVLRDLSIDPEPQASQVEAIRSVESQPVTQMYFGHAAPFWNDDGHAASLFTDGPAGMLAAARHGDHPEEVTSFTAWVMGPNAKRLDRLPEREAASIVLEAIALARPASAGNLEYLGRKAWSQDPFARGAWAYYKPGQISRFAAKMGQPHGRIQFCGEHLSRNARGMEGAMESGEGSAQAILRK
ncbi:MAG: NAD(P)/FAD-dependent oxidoreductase [Rhodospirillales bacterium]|nr:NAD(P)/FAD-dependent oxidoreductase [Rhodospirillales bacterium]MDE0712258.1 NAD(P)/FAD-dependent oxidoreductase [Rhodospirillales bacterium]